jgi:hypothetical protein
MGVTTISKTLRSVQTKQLNWSDPSRTSAVDNYSTKLA